MATPETTYCQGHDQLLGQLTKCEARILAFAKRRRLAESGVYSPEDFYQDVFLKCWKLRDESDANGNSIWAVDAEVLVFRIAHFVYVDFVRKSKRERSTFGSRSSLSEIGSKHDSLQENEFVEQVQSTLLQLSPLVREAIGFRFFDDLKPAEIAVRTNTDVNTINKRLQRAKSQLRSLILSGSG